MSYALNTRTNSDTRPATAPDDKEIIDKEIFDDKEVIDEIQRGDPDATFGEAESRIGDQAPSDQTSAEVPTDQTPAAGEEPAEPAAMTGQSQEQVYQERLPSDMTPPPMTSIWPEETVNQMRTRWQAVQLRFVDDPAAVTGEMQMLVGEAVQALSAALAERQRELDSWSHSGHDTEQLRLAVQRYRDFHEILLGHHHPDSAE
ncbi:MAG TPA: hypothetical protein VFC19_54885 [Candidatus Limnocylindrales bacterium]|nr:hypothetical protein [Candidatus Limnocylindrales bacterium]